MTPQQTIEQAIEALDQVKPANLTREQFRAQLSLRAMLEQMKQQEPVCRCDLRTKLVGDGCEVCNPECAADHTAPPLPQREGWQPIETAPKDGTEILVCTGEGCRYVVSYDDAFSAPWRIRNDQGLNEHVPARWMPLLAAPKPTEDE